MEDFKVIDDNMHFLPTDLFTNEKVLNRFLYSAPITFGIKQQLITSLADCLKQMGKHVRLSYF